MQGFKTTVYSLVAIMVVVVLGYWAFQTIEPGDVHAEREKQRMLEARNQELEEEVEKLRNELALLQPEETEEVAEAPAGEMEGIVAPTPAPTTSSKYASLVSDLQELVDDKVYMKVGSKGTRVGTVQTFLNIYFNTNKKIDNDYGKTMKTDVANFQKAVGLTSDGLAGPSTYQKMIEWLNKNS